jgi:hypothetical protein
MKHIPFYLIFAKNLKKPCAHNDFVVHFKRRLNSKLTNHWQYILERARNFPISEENILFPSYLITKGCLEKNLCISIWREIYMVQTTNGFGSSKFLLR